MQVWNSTPLHSSFASNSLGLSSSGFAALQVAGLPYSLKSMLQQMAEAPVLLERQPRLNDSSSRDFAHICLRRRKKPYPEATQASCRALGTPSLGVIGHSQSSNLFLGQKIPCWGKFVGRIERSCLVANCFSSVSPEM